MINKGQVTPIIILVIAIVVGFGIYSVLPDSGFENVEPSVEPIYNFVSECVRQITGEGIILVSSHGGYYRSPDGSLDNGIPYYFLNGKGNQPSKDLVGDEIELYVRENMQWCTNNFENFLDFNIEDSEISSEVVIREDSVKIELKYPLSVSKGEDSYQFENYLIEIPTRMGLLYDSAAYILEDQVEHPRSLCIACAYDVEEEYNFEVGSTTLSENDVLYTITDRDVLVNGEEVVFAFVNRLESV